MSVVYLNADSLGKLLGLSPETIRKLAKQGAIPSVRLSPKVLRFDAEAVKAALEARQEGRTLRDQGAAKVILSNWSASILLRRVYLALLLKSHPQPVPWDDLRRAQSLPPTVHPNTFGGTMLGLLAEGLAHPVEIVASDRPEAPARRVCVWACTDPAKVRRWLDTYSGLNLPEDPQKGLFEQADGGGE